MLMYFKLLNALYSDRRAVTAVEYAVVAAAVVGVVVAAFTGLGNAVSAKILAVTAAIG